MASNSSFVPLVEVTRAQRIESLHRGAIAVVDADGRLVASAGNPKEPVFVRSSAKPFQALALVCSGAADAYGVTEEELAVVCGSHSGEPRHIELVTSLMHKAGIRPGDLRCGVHPPFDPAARRALAESGEPPTVLHNNCSGKHAGMLAAARYLGLPLAGYTEPEHEIQVAIRGILAYLAGMDSDEVDTAVDGCTAPTFVLPLRAFALALARLAAAGESAEQAHSAPHESGVRAERRERRARLEQDDAADLAGDEEDEGAFAPDEGFPVSIPDALARVWRAMKNHPVLIAGSRNRLCTDLMRTAEHVGVPLVAKSGAEGVYAMAALQDDLPIGIALKVEDGAERGRNVAAVETLFQLECLPEAARPALAAYHQPVILNRLNQPVGEVHARFRLSYGL